MSLSFKPFLSATLIAFASQANADACDYAASRIAGKTAAALTGGAALTGAGMQAAGYYTLVHAGSGLTMLGSTAAGASAAGTIGIIGGTGGTIGAIGAFLMAPLTLIVGGIAVIAVGSFEGYCYFQVDRVTDPFQVREILESVALHDDNVSIVKTEDGPAMRLSISETYETYLLRNLYIADGQLKHRDWGMNTNLGPVAFTSKQSDAVSN